MSSRKVTVDFSNTYLIEDWIEPINSYIQATTMAWLHDGGEMAHDSLERIAEELGRALPSRIRMIADHHLLRVMLSAMDKAEQRLGGRERVMERGGIGVGEALRAASGAPPRSF